MLGVSYLQRNQLGEAEAQFQKLTDLAPDDPLGFANLGFTYLQAGRFADAGAARPRPQARPSNADIGLARPRLRADQPGRRVARAPRAAPSRSERQRTCPLRARAARLRRHGSRRECALSRSLRDVLGVASGNLVARLALVDAFVRASQSDSAVHQLEEVRRTPPEPTPEARARIDSTIQLLRAGNLAASRQMLDRLLQTMVVTSPYQASVEEVKWTEAAIPGRPVLTFVPKSFVSAHGVRDQAVSGFGNVYTPGDPNHPPLTRSDYDPGHRLSVTATYDLFISSLVARRAEAGPASTACAPASCATPQSAGIVLPSGASFATFADFDNDGWLDLFAIGGDGRGYLFRNAGKNGSLKFRSGVRAASIPEGSPGANSVDHTSKGLAFCSRYVPIDLQDESPREATHG
jgi:hypothetical protein